MINLTEKAWVVISLKEELVRIYSNGGPGTWSYEDIVLIDGVSIDTEREAGLNDHMIISGKHKRWRWVLNPFGVDDVTKEDLSLFERKYFKRIFKKARVPGYLFKQLCFSHWEFRPANSSGWIPYKEKRQVSVSIPKHFTVLTY